MKHGSCEGCFGASFDTRMQCAGCVDHSKWEKSSEMKTSVISEIFDELDRACAKFPTWPTDPLHALAVLGEEFGELTKEVLQMTYEPHKTDHARIHDEAIQTAAMAIRFAASLERYQHVQSAQHTQDVVEVPGLPQACA